MSECTRAREFLRGVMRSLHGLFVLSTAYGNLGSILSGQGRVAEAEWAYRKALDHRANMADVHYNL